MGKVIDVLSLFLLAAAATSFGIGVHQLGASNDLAALYWFAGGGLALKASVELLRPKAGTR
jgi:predicted component of type VI protein secretion system